MIVASFSSAEWNHRKLTPPKSHHRIKYLTVSNCLLASISSAAPGEQGPRAPVLGSFALVPLLFGSIRTLAQ